MNKYTILLIFLFTFFELNSNVFAVAENIQKTQSSYQHSRYNKDKKFEKKHKLKHYHGDYVKFSSNKSCCRIRD